MIHNQVRRYLMRWADGKSRVEEGILKKKYDKVGEEVTKDNYQLARYVDHTDAQDQQFKQI